MTTLRVPNKRQGQTGKGQGGYTCQRFAAAIGERVTVALRSPIPLEVDLDIVHRDDGWQLVDPSDPARPILEATRWAAAFPSTEPVGVDDARAARDRLELGEIDHPAPHCASCGVGPDSLRVHAGPLGDGRWATPLRLPALGLDSHPTDSSAVIDEALVWMAMDCACGWYVSDSSDDDRRAVTVQLAVEIAGPIEPDTDYALVSWHGDGPAAWDGRKRTAAAALFDETGRCVAQSVSLWVSV